MTFETESEKPAHPPLKPGEAWDLLKGLGSRTDSDTPNNFPRHTEDKER